MNANSRGDIRSNKQARSAMEATAALGVAALAGCATLQRGAREITGELPVEPLPLPNDPARARVAARVLGRAGFGWRPGDIARADHMGIGNWLEDQLKPLPEDRPKPKKEGVAAWLDSQFDPGPTDPPSVAWRINGLDSQQFLTDGPEMLYGLADEQLAREMQQAALIRAIYNPKQLREVVADFWTNHFNIYALKLDERVLLPIDTVNVIRRHSMGSFRDLLLASSRSPAMLMYLDNQVNKAGVVNENYAREILELHSLGVHAGYSLKDIREVARCFTGHTVGEGFYRGVRSYDPKKHDDGAKQIPFLNLHIPAGQGERDAELVVDRLAEHPATARFIASKLCIRFLGEAYEPAVEKAASAYLRSKGSVPATLRPILFDYLMTGEGVTPALRRPLDFVAAAGRCLAVDTDAGADFQSHLAAMGQPLYHWPMPNGFPEKATAWTGSVLGRWNLAADLLGGRIGGSNVPVARVLPGMGKSPSEVARQCLELATGIPATAKTSTKLLSVLEARAAAEWPKGPEVASRAVLALAVSSPAFQWKPM